MNTFELVDLLDSWTPHFLNHPQPALTCPMDEIRGIAAARTEAEGSLPRHKNLCDTVGLDGPWGVSLWKKNKYGCINGLVWIGLLGKIETGNHMVFTIKYRLGLSCKFSHHPILWVYLKMDENGIPPIPLDDHLKSPPSNGHVADFFPVDRCTPISERPTWKNPLYMFSMMLHPKF